jgi:hypothetical protein
MLQGGATQIDKEIDTHNDYCDIPFASLRK